MAPPVQFLSFSCSFRQKCYQIIYWHLPLENPGSTTGTGLFTSLLRNIDQLLRQCDCFAVFAVILLYTCAESSSIAVYMSHCD